MEIGTLIISKETAEIKLLFDKDEVKEFLEENNIADNEVVIMPCVEDNNSELKLYQNNNINSPFDFVADYADELLNSDLEETKDIPVKISFADEPDKY